MRLFGFFQLMVFCVLSSVLVTPKASAAISLAASLGYGHQVSPTRQTQATNLMVAPGLGFGNMLRAELGFVGAWQAAKAGQKEGLALEIRPMLVASPPLIPLYARLVLAAVAPFSAERTVAYGGALGTTISLFGLGVFAEAGILPRSINRSISWVAEARLGGYYLL